MVRTSVAARRPAARSTTSHRARHVVWSKWPRLMYALARKLPNRQPGERHGRADSFPRHCNANSATHRRISRRSLRLSERTTLAALLSNAAGVSLLRHGARVGGRVESQVSSRKGHLEPVAESLHHQPELGLMMETF